METAYFIPDPRRIEELQVPHALDRETPYEIVKTVSLSAIDYGNFITDLAADRQFIEDHAHLCEKGPVWKCLLVKRRGRTDGVLIMPEDGCYVGWAAYYVKKVGHSCPCDCF